MPTERLKKGDLLVAYLVSGFELAPRSYSLRLTASGRAYYERSWSEPEGGRTEHRAKHDFNASAMNRMRSLLQGLPPQGPATVIIDDFASWHFEFWSGDEVRTVSSLEVFLEERTRGYYEEQHRESYPALPRLRAVWSILRYPFERKYQQPPSR
ncbi:hypothetical protein F0U60_31815 [Archangium minus]|uniref:Uncharacterized protein n=1 Tax=Archangium minus TaxID=83450 RepID=A0ABY9WYK8_9BACT|nr:hypothetical protein F0U60_31815 [Archangium minus]